MKKEGRRGDFAEEGTKRRRVMKKGDLKRESVVRGRVVI
jgi:hypothetical protein